jgi:hypothetical protein
MIWYNFVYIKIYCFIIIYFVPVLLCVKLISYIIAILLIFIVSSIGNEWNAISMIVMIDILVFLDVY